MSEVKLNYFSESGKEIFYGTEHSAGLDLPFYDPEVEEVIVNPGERVMLKTGIYMKIPENMYGEIDARSSTSKLLLIPLCRTIDNDYIGNIRVVVTNVGHKPQTVKRGDYLAQIIIKPYVKVAPTTVASPDALGATDRGHSGFGSTGNTSATK